MFCFLDTTGRTNQNILVLIKFLKKKEIMMFVFGFLALEKPKITFNFKKRICRNSTHLLQRHSTNSSKVPTHLLQRHSTNSSNPNGVLLPVETNQR